MMVTADIIVVMICPIINTRLPAAEPRIKSPDFNAATDMTY
jgi:hypothetical protein